ncbi:amidohydrolase 3 [Candidatus Vecturithrix granuli]|uniref:Amidohydrolase 3 n=1 Tax=Vecturithrix granuli TaxID=1499967 RepID=A0A081C1W9_VECG1|nr:amidohydrolase 3 [Candidatus Vecturithrix granuli]
MIKIFRVFGVFRGLNNDRLMYDLKIVNAQMVDFEQQEFVLCDLGIEQGKIAEIGAITAPAKKEIDAGGQVAAPGFLDIHMHEEVLGESADGDDYDIANKMLLMGVTTCVGGNCGKNRQPAKEFLTFIDQHGAPVNYLLYVGHNSLRQYVGVPTSYDKATPAQIEQMQQHVRSALDDGVIGISFGFEYDPGIELNETIQVCQAAADRQILLAAHYRSDAAAGLDSIREMIEISKITGQPMQISHLGSCTAMGYMRESLEIIQAAIDTGVDVEADCYPYHAFCTFIGSAVFDEGCFERWNTSYDSILLTEEPFKGQYCSEELFHKARKEYPNMLAVAFVMNEEEVIECLKAPIVTVASDGVLRKGNGHPRAAGTFPRVLGRYVRERQELTLIEALEKMTLKPARRLKLDQHKGQIKVGWDADLVIFDPATILDGATFEAPALPPEGIQAVIVNGELAVQGTQIVNARLGRAIRRQDIPGWEV